MKNLIEKIEKWTCKARELMDKDVEVIQLEQLKEEIASAREELKKRYKEHGFKTKEFFDIIDEVLGEK